MADAFIKLYKKMLDWEWYDDPNTCRLFIHCLLKANWKSGSWHGINYEPGQFITSLPSLAAETKLSVRQVRVALDHLKMTGELTDFRQSNCRVITVNNWNEYQGNDRPNVKRVTDKRQTCDRPVTVDKEYKEREEGKELKNNTPYNPPEYYPNDEILNKAFSDYVAMRKQIKKPLTDRAIELAMKKLDELSNGNNDIAIKIIEQSIMNSWQGLFPLKDTSHNNGSIDWSQV